MRSVADALGFGYGEDAFINPMASRSGCIRNKRRGCRALGEPAPFLGKMLTDWRGAAAAVIARGPWNRGGVIRVEAGAALGSARRLGRRAGPVRLTRWQVSRHREGLIFSVLSFRAIARLSAVVFLSPLGVAIECSFPMAIKL